MPEGGNGPDLVVKGGRIVDETGERSGDVVVSDGRIAAIGPDLDADVVLDAGGCVVAPGLVDLHTHLRQPGKEEAETVESGSRAAALGGYTCVVAMPNTTPAIDSRRRRARGAGARANRALPGRGDRRDHRGPGRRAAEPDGGDGRPRRAHLHRRRNRRAGRPAHAAGDGVRDGARGDAGAALRGDRAERGHVHARGRVVVAARARRAAVGGRGADGHARHRAEPSDGRADALPAPVDRRVGGDGRRGEGGRPADHRRGGAAPLHADRRVLQGLRRGVQGAPAAADRRRRRRRSAPGCATARSTPSPPITRPIPATRRSAPSTRRPRGCWASSTRWRWR